MAKDLIREAFQIELEEAKEAGALGFTARGLVQATMPHRDTGKLHHKRINGDYSLIMAVSDRGICPYSLPAVKFHLNAAFTLLLLCR